MSKKNEIVTLPGVSKQDPFLDFVLVGAPRCGTTWLANVLMQHPDIYVPEVKELNFFGRPVLGQIRDDYKFGMKFYRQYFENAPLGALCGELTPTYFIDPEAAARIQYYFPDTKILLHFRNPAEMMHSLYLRMLAETPMEADFELSLERWPDIFEASRYHTHLQPYLELFPRENIYVGIAEDIFDDPEAACRHVYHFLGVDPEFQPKNPKTKVNERGHPRSRALVNVLHRFRQFYNAVPLGPLRQKLSSWETVHRFHRNILSFNYETGNPEALKLETRSKLIQRCMPEIEAMEHFLGRDLPAWKI